MENKWNSVLDNMPTSRYEPCLVFNGDAPKYNQHVFQATWFSQNNEFSTDCDYLGTITHWMLLPNPPNI